jgi:glycosyltransferase involved in cell wall biosynthesis
MRIGINAVFLQHPTTGSGQHLLNLLRGLDACDNKNEYVLLSPRFPHAYAADPQLGRNFQNVEAFGAIARLGENAEKLWWEQVGLVWASMKERVDLLHSPYWANPLASPVPTVVTIHDVIQFVLPQYRWRKMSRMYYWLVSRAARRARAIIAVSECSKKDIVNLLGIPPERIFVIGNAVDESFRPISDSWQLAAVRERYGIEPEYMLYFGGFDLRKNVHRIIQAYLRMPTEVRQRYQLVIAGRLHLLGHPLYPDPRPMVRELGQEDRIIFTGQIREQDKAPLYSGATLFAFPSLYEGFGMPVLEAMACGTPVVTSNLSALPEVVGDAGVLVDPYSVEAICEAMAELLCDPARRRNLGQAARERSRGFTWREVAEKTVSVYGRVALQ